MKVAALRVYRNFAAQTTQFRGDALNILIRKDCQFEFLFVLEKVEGDLRKPLGMFVGD